MRERGVFGLGLFCSRGNFPFPAKITSTTIPLTQLKWQLPPRKSPQFIPPSHDEGKLIAFKKQTYLIRAENSPSEARIPNGDVRREKSTMSTTYSLCPYP
jgi:hypothetical protein